MVSKVTADEFKKEQGDKMYGIGNARMNGIRIESKDQMHETGNVRKNGIRIEKLIIGGSEKCVRSI